MRAVDKIHEALTDIERQLLNSNLSYEEIKEIEDHIFRIDIMVIPCCLNNKKNEERDANKSTEVD